MENRYVSFSSDFEFWVVHQQSQRVQHVPGGGPRGVMVKTMDSGIVVREFVLQLRYYVHFRANTLGKGTNLLILLAMG